MGKTRIWEVDRLAAGSLLAALRLEADDAALDLVAKSFSAHRQQACDWAAQRLQRSVIDALETASTHAFQHRDASWAEGFIFAEQCLLEMDPVRALGTEVSEAPSKGRILRNMVREAKRKSLEG